MIEEDTTTHEEELPSETPSLEEGDFSHEQNEIIDETSSPEVFSEEEIKTPSQGFSGYIEESISSEEKNTPSQETLFPEKEKEPSSQEENEPSAKEELEEGVAHVDFDLLDTEGRWLLKVISGPNTGAEFAMHSGSSYLLGTDTRECDIIFQDLSVSRKHARITIDTRDNALLEDLGSRNGTFINGEKIKKKEIIGNMLVSIGTTSFMLYDREAEHTTIVASSMQQKREESSSFQEKKQEGKSQPLGPIQEAVLAPLQSEVDRVKEKERFITKAANAISSLTILAIVTALILLMGVGTIFLFRTEEILTPKVSDPEIEISRVLSEYPAIRYSYNPSNNRLMLVGHVLTITDRSKLMDSLQQLKFLRDIDYNSVVIDELVWRETNQLLSKNPTWRGISLTSPIAGKYLVTGFLRTRNQANELFDYLSLNFPYMDLLEKKVIIEQDLLAQVTRELSESGFRGVTPTLSGGELILSGSIGQGTKEKFQKLVVLFKSLPGIRNVNIAATEAGQKEAFVDLTEKYRVSGFAKSGKKSSVVVNGRILAPGDVLDGMLVIEISATTVLLEKDGVKYKIDFNR